MADVLSPEQRAFVLAVAHRVVPQTRGEPAEADARFLAIVENAIGSRPTAMQRQLKLFLKVLRWAPLLRYRAPLDRLAPERQDTVLAWFQDAPAPLVRKGFWGLKALIFMGYYGQQGLHETFGYRPAHQGGNEKLRAAHAARSGGLAGRRPPHPSAPQGRIPEGPLPPGEGVSKDLMQ